MPCTEINQACHRERERERFCRRSHSHTHTHIQREIKRVREREQKRERERETHCDSGGQSRWLGSEVQPPVSIQRYKILFYFI